MVAQIKVFGQCFGRAVTRMVDGFSPNTVQLSIGFPTHIAVQLAKHILDAEKAVPV
jgi:hypothetical protein